MIDASTPQSKEASFSSQFVKTAIMLGEDGVEAFLRLYPYTAWLESSLFSSLTNTVIRALGGSIQSHVEELVGLIVVELSINGQESQVHKTMSELIVAKQLGNTDDIKTAHNNFNVAIHNLVHWDLPTNP